MPTNVDDIIRKLIPAQRKKVEALATQLIAEEMTLRELPGGRRLPTARVLELADEVRVELRPARAQSRRRGR